MTIATTPPTPPPRYNPEVYHEQSLSPIADLSLDFVVLQGELLTMQARINRALGTLSELTQRQELGDKRAKRKAPLREQQGDSTAESRD